VWQNGKVTELGLGVEPVAINERGQVIGFRAGPGCEWRCVHAVLWQKGIRTDLGTLGGKWAIPTAISDRGQVVGYMGYGVDSTRSGEQHAFVWQDGVMTRLPSPFPGARTRAIAINDRNQIIGDNCLADCGSREPSARSKFAVIWTLK
jgi:probable HAF family extracellular repeat protein